MERAMERATSESVRERVQRILELTTRLLVDTGDDVEVSQVLLGSNLVFLIKTSRPGLIVGKRGSTINAIRTVIGKIASSVDQRISVEVERTPTGRA